VRGYESLVAWQLAQQFCLGVLKVTDGPLPRRARAVTDQLRRAAVSVDVNIVEGYALGTRSLFLRHVRIALGSAAEAQRLLRIAMTCGYLSPETAQPLVEIADRTMACLSGLFRSKHLPFPQAGQRH
jgi:four helix bundle protein